MRIDTSSRPASLVGRQNERESLIAWFIEYQALDMNSQIIVEESEYNNLIFYFSSNDTLKEIQENAMIAKKKLAK